MTTLLLVIAWILLGGIAVAGLIATAIIAFGVSVAIESRWGSLLAIPVFIFGTLLPIALLALAINLINTHVGV